MIDSRQTVLVTGAAGFLGRYIARHFSEQGWSVAGIDQMPGASVRIDGVSRYYCMQLPDAALPEVIRKERPSLCVHCAGMSSVPLSVKDPAADYHAGPVLTFEVLNALRLDAPACRFVLLSSAAVYGNPATLPVREDHPAAPISPYGFHKLQCEHLCREFSVVYGLPTVSLRIFSAYGPGLKRQVLWDICSKVFVDGALALQGTGSESRDFIHAADIAHAVRIAANAAPLRGEAFNIASGDQTSIRKLSAMVLEALGSPVPPVFDGVLPAGTPVNWQADISRLRSLGFSASRPLADGIREVADWCRRELRSP